MSELAIGVTAIVGNIIGCTLIGQYAAESGRSYLWAFSASSSLSCIFLLLLEAAQ